MEKVKKILALVMVFAMVVSTGAFAAVPNDVKGTDYVEAASVLGVLNIMNGDAGGFRPNDTITRAEFAAVVARSLDLEDAAKVSGGSTEYTDVPSTHWAAGYINLASDMGIINGYGNGEFGPEDTVKYEQAITMIVRALGYEPAAEDKGGYPVGYLVIASNEGITDDVDAVSGTPAIRGDVAQMIYNSLTVDLMEQTGYGDDATYETEAGKNLLSEKLDVDKVIGVVSGTYYADFDRNLGENEVAIKLREVNDKEVTETIEKYETADNVNADKWLGYEVELFVTDDDEIIKISKTDNNKLLLANFKGTSDDGKHQTDLTENYDNDGNVKSYTFKYYIDADDDWETVKVDKDVLCAINGEDVNQRFIVHRKEDPNPNLDYTYATLTNDSYNMRLTLVNNDGDGDYDFIDQACGAPAVFDYYDKDDNTIYTLRSGDLTYEFDDDDKVEVSSLAASFLGTGPDLTLEDIKHGDVISCTMTPSKNKYSIMVSSMQEEGVVEEVRINYTKHYYKGYLVDVPSYHVTVNGVEMELDLGGVVNLTDGKDEMISFEEFNIGDEGVFKKDLEGKLVAVDLSKSTKTLNYGYLIDSVPAESGFDSGRKLKILTASGNEVVYDGDDEIEIDGDEYDADRIFDEEDDDTEDLNDDDAIDGEGSIDDKDLDSRYIRLNSGQLIKYELNSDGDIVNIYTGASSEAKYKATASNATYDEDTHKFGDSSVEYKLDKDTIVFYINESDMDESDVYGYEDIDEDNDDPNGYAEVLFYKVSSIGKADVVVIKDTSFVGASSDYEIAVVERVSTAKNDSDDNVDKLYGFIKGEEVTQLAEDGVKINDNSARANVGDILYITYNGDGEIDDVEKIAFDYETGVVGLAVYDKDSDTIVVWESNDKETYTFADTYYVYKYDESKDDLTVESYSDIKTVDKNDDNYSEVGLGLNDDDQVEVIVIYSE